MTFLIHNFFLTKISKILRIWSNITFLEHLFLYYKNRFWLRRWVENRIWLRQLSTNNNCVSETNLWLICTLIFLCNLTKKLTLVMLIFLLAIVTVDKQYTLYSSTLKVQQNIKKYYLRSSSTTSFGWKSK